MVNPNHSFHIADYSIFAVTIIVSLGIGLYYALSGGKQRTTSEYLVGNRQMMIIPVAISLMVSFESSIMMLGTPAEIYVYGLQWLVGNFGFFLANMMAIFVVVPLIHPLRITSAYEYLEMRFKSRAVRILGTLFGMLGYAAYMGIVLFGPAIALEAVTGFPQWASIVAVAVAAVIYTAIGGLKAVIWTDVFQCVVMFAGFFAVLIKGTMQIGGIGKTWQIASAKGRVNFFNFDPDPTVRHTFWNLFLGSIIRGFGLVFNQSSVQRISSTPTVSAATKVLLFTAPAFFLSITLAGIEGVVAYAYYDSIGCDPLASKQITNPNQIVPHMVMEIFEGLPGMPGLFMASLFSASLSTLSSGLSSLSALFWADLVKPHAKPMSEFKATVIAKLAVVFFGFMAIAIAFGISYVGGTLIQIAGSILSAIGGPLTGLFMLGAFVPFANSKGAIVGPLVTAAFCFLLAIGQMSTKGSVKNTKLPSAPIDQCPGINASFIPDFLPNSTAVSPIGIDDNPFLLDIITNVTSLASGMDMDIPTSTKSIALGGMLGSTATYVVTEDIPEPTGFRRLFMLSYQWFGSVGIIGTMLIGTIVSILTGRSKPGEVDPRFLIPFYDKFFWFLPESIRKYLRCGFDYTKKPTMNGDSGEYTKVNNIGDYEVIIQDPTKPVELNSIATISPNHLEEPAVHKSFDDLIVPKFHFSDKEYELIDLRDRATGARRRSHETHIVIDRTVNSVIKLRAESIEIDVPAKVPSVEIIPPTPDEENIDNLINQAQTPQTAAELKDDIQTSEEAGRYFSLSAELRSDGTKGTGATSEPNDETDVDKEDNAKVTQRLDNVQTIELDEIDDNERSYGLAVVLNGKVEN